MTEEKLKQYIEDKRPAGASDPFKVPEGYFDSFCDRVMSQLPEQQQTIRRTLIPRVWRYAAAAVVVGLIASVAVLVPQFKQGQEDMQLASNHVESDMSLDEEYFNEVLDYSMLNNNDIAYYLTEN
ncbi:MAG: hypothetical protein MJZ35_04345 [Bacteroidaceae bacterium]|nr:hypothetical protein [Bacteroidaceae bacterium]